MNREMLFRGKRIDNGEWVYGYVVKYGWTRNEKWYIVPDYASALYAFEVAPSTVGQYTGLTDKNGAKIFEGDIVHCVSHTDTGNCIVIFEEGEFRLIPDKYYKTYTTGGGFHAVYCFVKEVIGTIYDKEARDGQA